MIRAVALMCVGWLKDHIAWATEVALASASTGVQIGLWSMRRNSLCIVGRVCGEVLQVAVGSKVPAGRIWTLRIRPEADRCRQRAGMFAVKSSLTAAVAPSQFLGLLGEVFATVCTPRPSYAAVVSSGVILRVSVFKETWLFGCCSSGNCIDRAACNLTCMEHVEKKPTLLIGSRNGQPYMPDRGFLVTVQHQYDCHFSSSNLERCAS